MTNWGILGAGNIAGQFVHDLLLHENSHTIVAIGSSNNAKAQAFLDKAVCVAERNNGVTPKTQLYEELYANPEVDVVYVATPHMMHEEQVLQALQHGKHVLCEKPITVTGKQARRIFAEAEKQNKLVLEATWTRFFPSVALAKELVFKHKLLGDVQRLTADFSNNLNLADWSELSRARNINLAAGSLLDVGIYPLTYARIFLDENLGKKAAKFSTKSFLTLDPVDKVDHLATVIVRYENGKHAVLTSANHTKGPQPFLRLVGTEATLEMYSENPAQAKSFRIIRNDGKLLAEDKDESACHGFLYEADAMADAIKQGKTQVDLLPWDETLLVMDTLDAIRWENGFYYPGE